MKIQLPQDVSYIISKLEAAGFEAYAVGGCVRDSLLGISPGDWDITTSARPDKLLTVFSNDHVIPTGLKHGTITVMRHKKAYEITSYRIDGAYSDGRRPDSVGFTDSLSEDLSRRDFTINAMAYNEKRGLVDLFSGVNDLESGLIRCVGRAEERFAEDYLRMLRAYRFSCVLNFELDDEITTVCARERERLKSISAERICAEFNKILLSSNFPRVEAFLRVFSDVLFPEVYATIGFKQNNPYHDKDVFSHSMAVLAHTPAELDMRLAAVFHDVGKPASKTVDDETGHFHFTGHEVKSAAMAKNALLRLKYDNKTIAGVCDIICHHGHEGISCAEKPALRRLVNKTGFENAEKTLVFYICDLMGKTEYARRELDDARRRIGLLTEIKRDGDACFVGDLKIGGNNIMALSGQARGKLVGETLNYLLGRCIDEPALNEREILLNLAGDYLDSRMK